MTNGIMENSRWNSWQVIVFCVSAFASTHFARMNWAIVSPFAEEALGLTKTMTGLLMTAPFIAYALMQIPAGILADRMDDRKLMGIALLATGTVTLATSLFSTFTSIFLLRLLIGFVASFVFTPSLRLLSLSVDKKKKGRAIGVFFMAPTIALIILGLIVPHLAENFGWQLPIFITGIPGIVTGLLVILSARGAIVINQETKSNQVSLKNGMLQLIRDPNLVLCFFASFMSGFSLSGAKMWLIDYLILSLGVTSVFAGVVYSLFNLIVLVNKPISGWVSDFLRKRKPVISISLFATAIACFLIALSSEPNNSIVMILCLGMVLGFQLTASTALLTELSSVEVLGIAISTQNMMGMLSYSFQSPLSGYILDSSGSYLAVWFLFAITASVAALLYALVKE